MHLQIIYIMYKEDFTLNNLRELICHRTQPNPNKQKEFEKEIGRTGNPSKV